VCRICSRTVFKPQCMPCKFVILCWALLCNSCFAWSVAKQFFSEPLHLLTLNPKSLDTFCQCEGTGVEIKKVSLIMLAPQPIDCFLFVKVVINWSGDLLSRFICCWFPDRKSGLIVQLCFRVCHLSFPHLPTACCHTYTSHNCMFWSKDHPWSFIITECVHWHTCSSRNFSSSPNLRDKIKVAVGDGTEIFRDRCSLSSLWYTGCS
jgi:hypothetical protein